MNVCSATISAAPGIVHRAGPRKTISRTWGHSAVSSPPSTPCLFCRLPPFLFPSPLALSASVRSSRCRRPLALTSHDVIAIFRDFGYHSDPRDLAFRMISRREILRTIVLRSRSALETSCALREYPRPIRSHGNTRERTEQGRVKSGGE
jgi:hypothetical protein